MSDIYDKVFKEFKKRLEEDQRQIFLAPLPFTAINKLSMLAATVASDCAVETEEKEKEQCQTT